MAGVRCSAILVTSLLVLTLAATIADTGPIRVGVVFDAGGKDDKSFNSASWRGAVSARDTYGIELKDVEPGAPSNIEPAIRAFAERNFDLILGVGFATAPYIEKVAAAHPDIKFAVVDTVVDLPNVASLVFEEHEGSFLVGMIAAMKSKTGIIGFVGGMDIPLIHKFEVGYREGARYVNPQIKVLRNYAGITPAAWTDPTKGKELAKAQYAQGADVIFAPAGATNLGVFDAAEEEKKFAIGVDLNQNWIRPGYILTSMLKNIDGSVYDVIRKMVEGNFQGGTNRYNLYNDGVGYAVDQYNEHLLTKDIIDAVEQAKRDIIAGKINVTDYTAQ